MERPPLARAARAVVAGGVALALLLAPLTTRAAADKGGDAKGAAPPAPAPTPAGPSPADAQAALERVRAAYEYGEMEMVVDAARLVAEGRLQPTPVQRATALRYLGIGLFLTGSREGAETAFFDLLRLRPRTRLDATTTRPDVVAFFEDVRRRHAIEINAADKNRPGKSLVLALLPPAGQFQAGHTARGITIAAIEGLSLVGAIGTYAQLKAWRRSDDTFGPPLGQPGTDHTETAQTLLALNKVSIIVLVATIAVGIVDGVASYLAVEPEDTGASSVADVFGRGYRF